MDPSHQPSTQPWLIKATPVIRRVEEAKSRFAVSMTVNTVTMLAAADELQVATWDATLWTAMNACPDVDLGERVALALNTCAEVALTAQRVIADDSADMGSVVGRLGDLLSVIDFRDDTADIC